MAHPQGQGPPISYAGWRELAAQGLMGVVAVFFLIRYAKGGTDTYWWICLVLFVVGLAAWIRALRRAWIQRGH